MEISEFFQNSAVIWFIIGLLFFLLEFIVPGLIVLFFGIGAWITAILTLIFDFSLETELVLFLITSVSSLIFLRKYFKRIFVGKDENSTDEELEEFIGKHATVTEDIAPDKPGKVSFKGANWNAESDEVIEKGKQVEIVARESINFTVKSINK